MKHEITSLNTKKALAASFKKLLSQKLLSKLTVSEIIQDCGVNRKTFYYHFDDIYALLIWTLEQEAIDVVRKFDLIVEYEEMILFVMNYIDENDAMLNNICDSVGRSQLKSFFYNDFIGITSSFINSVEKQLLLTVNTDFKAFLSSFYAEAISGILLDWISNRALRNRERTVRYIEVIIQASLPNILQEASKLPRISNIK